MLYGLARALANIIGRVGPGIDNTGAGADLGRVRHRLGLVVSQYLAGRWAANVNRLRLILVTGMLLNVAGLLLLGTLAAGTTTIVFGLYFLVTGVGMAWCRWWS